LMFGVMELQKFWLNRMGKILSRRRWLAITVNTVIKEIKIAHSSFIKVIGYHALS
jgi:hypothetical protein